MVLESTWVEAGVPVRSGWPAVGDADGARQNLQVLAVDMRVLPGWGAPASWHWQ
jgi:hypothetical protein